MVGFWGICVGQDKGLGPNGPKSLSAHRFLESTPICGESTHLALCPMLQGKKESPRPASSRYIPEKLP